MVHPTFRCLRGKSRGNYLASRKIKDVQCRPSTFTATFYTLHIHLYGYPHLSHLFSNLLHIALPTLSDRFALTKWPRRNDLLLRDPSSLAGQLTSPKMARSIKDITPEAEEEVEEAEEVEEVEDPEMDEIEEIEDLQTHSTPRQKGSRSDSHPNNHATDSAKRDIDVVTANRTSPAPVNLSDSLFPVEEDWEEPRPRLDKGKGRAVEHGEDAPSVISVGSCSASSSSHRTQSSSRQTTRSSNSRGRNGRRSRQVVVEVPLLPLSELDEYTLFPSDIDGPSRSSRAALLEDEEDSDLSDLTSRSPSPRVRPKRNIQPTRPTWKTFSTPSYSEDELRLASHDPNLDSEGEYGEDELSDEDEEEDDSDDGEFLQRPKRRNHQSTRVSPLRSSFSLCHSTIIFLSAHHPPTLLCYDRRIKGGPRPSLFPITARIFH